MNNIIDSQNLEKSMIDGYIEMSEINLSIALECSELEYEASLMMISYIDEFKDGE